ncbi:MAG: hypothetical protein E7433_00795 [Ruminococcaceae bacterium]|nr:hypothetical protein [Oscillospiraceae bacterium]
MDPEIANDLLSPEIISAIISAFGTIAAAIIAWISAKFTAKREIHKLRLSWEREDNILRKKAFADMGAAVSRYIQSGWSRHQREALEAIAFVRSSDGETASEIENLYEAVLGGEIEQCKTALAEAALSHQQVTSQQHKHRRAKRKQKTY